MIIKCRYSKLFKINSNNIDIRLRCGFVRPMKKTKVLTIDYTTVYIHRFLITIVLKYIFFSIYLYYYYTRETAVLLTVLQTVVLITNCNNLEINQYWETIRLLLIIINVCQFHQPWVSTIHYYYRSIILM